MGTFRFSASGARILVILAVWGLLIGARFADGPLEIIAGGPFRSGQMVTEPPPDWSFLHDTEEIEFQLLDPPRSRTTWIVEHGGKAYVPSSYMTTWWGQTGAGAAALKMIA